MKEGWIFLCGIFGAKKQQKRRITAKRLWMKSISVVVLWRKIFNSSQSLYDPENHFFICLYPKHGPTNVSLLWNHFQDTNQKHNAMPTPIMALFIMKPKVDRYRTYNISMRGMHAKHNSVFGIPFKPIITWLGQLSYSIKFHTFRCHNTSTAKGQIWTQWKLNLNVFKAVKRAFFEISEQFLNSSKAVWI